MVAVFSQGVAQVEDEFGEEVEDFQEQAGGQIQSEQLDVIDTLIRGNGQKVVSDTHVKGSRAHGADTLLQVKVRSDNALHNGRDTRPLTSEVQQEKIVYLSHARCTDTLHCAKTQHQTQ